MSGTAQEIFKYANKKRSILSEEAYKGLKERSIEAVTEMMKSGCFLTEFDLLEDDLPVLTRLTADFVKLGYRYCLVEVQDMEEQVVKHRLRVSVSHWSEM